MADLTEIAAYDGPIENTGGLSPEAEARLVRRAAGAGQDLPLPDLADHHAVAAWRAEQDASWGTDVEPGEPPHTPITVGGVPALQAGPDDGATVLYCHGGGFCLGSAGTAIPITARLANRHSVTSIDYRLAPEHPHPAGLDDTEAAFTALASAGPVALAGDSAGANLAVALTLRLAAGGGDGPRPVALVLFCPHLDARPRAVTADLEAMMRSYRRRSTAGDPTVSPLAAPDDLIATLPPTLIQTTTTEPLHPQALAFTRRATELGVPVTLQVWAGLWHDWQYHRELPEAHAAVDSAADWLAERWGRHDDGQRS